MLWWLHTSCDSVPNVWDFTNLVSDTSLFYSIVQSASLIKCWHVDLWNISKGNREIVYLSKPFFNQSTRRLLFPALLFAFSFSFSIKFACSWRRAHQLPLASHKNGKIQMSSLIVGKFVVYLIELALEKLQKIYSSLTMQSWHCLRLVAIFYFSAGVGRTGVLIFMETAFNMIEAAEPIFPLEIVRRMRDQRCSLIQTPVRYPFNCQEC